jgi:hypothetical protein
MKAGNFSEILGAQRGRVATHFAGAANCAGRRHGIPLTNARIHRLSTDRYTIRPRSQRYRCNPLTAPIQTMVERLPFAGNIIPTASMYAPSRLSCSTSRIANLPGLQNNFITDQNLNRPYRSYLFKVDHNINSNNRLSGKYYHSRNTEDRYNLTQEEGSIFQGFENRRNHGGNVDWTSTINSNFVLDVRSSFNLFKLRRFQDGQPTAGSSDSPASRRIVRITFSRDSTLLTT